MRQALEGSQALARAVALCRPQVVAAYPITPQTHIVENIAKLVADGVLDCEYVSVESEFSAASVVLGAAAAGSAWFVCSRADGSPASLNIPRHPEHSTLRPRADAGADSGLPQWGHFNRSFSTILDPFCHGTQLGLA